MKVGDLVTMPGSCYRDDPDNETIGVVVKLPQPTDSSKRAGIYWMDGDGHIDWEPIEWLEVMNETRP